MSTLRLWPDRTAAWLQQHDLRHARTGQGLCTSVHPLMLSLATLHAFLGSRHPYYTLHRKRRHSKPQRCVFRSDYKYRERQPWPRATMWILESAARVGRVSIGPEHPSLFPCIRTLSDRDLNTTPTYMNTFLHCLICTRPTSPCVRVRRYKPKHGSLDAAAAATKGTLSLIRKGAHKDPPKCSMCHEVATGTFFECITCAQVCSFVGP